MKRPRSLRFHMLTVLTALLLIAVSLSVLMYSGYEAQYKEKLLEINADTIRQLSENITLNYKSLLTTLESFATNSVVQQFVGATDPYEKWRNSQLLSNLELNYKNINRSLSAILLRTSAGAIYTDASLPSFNSILAAKAFAALDAGAPSCPVTVGSKRYVAFQRPIYDPNVSRHLLGHCLFLVDVSFVVGFIEKAELRTGSEFYILDENATIISSNNPSRVFSALPDAYTSYLQENQGEPYSAIDDTYIIVTEYLPEAHWTVLCMTPQEAVFQELTQVTRRTLFILGTMGVLLIAVYMRYFQSITGDVKRFVRHMQSVSLEGDSKPLYLTANAEFQELSSGFNAMMEKLRQLNEHNLAYQRQLLTQEIENKKSQLLALQSQINPHFLYNTLECINSAGAVCGSDDVQQMSTALAYIFRYSIKGSHVVCVGDEVDAIRCYMKIQQIRFPGRFSMLFDIDDDTLSLRMLKFVLQPILENCIIHGVESSTKRCTIRLHIRQEGGMLHLTISDDGGGMAPERLAALNSALAQREELSTSSGSIGLTNINRRIALYYGEAYGLHIQSTLLKGTQVDLIIPVATEENRTTA